MKPVICMITGGLCRTEDAGRADDLLGRVAAAARAGVHLVQVRERALDARSLTALVEACLDAVRHTATRIVVNERLDVARAAGAHGVHLRGDSVAAARVRAIVEPGFLIGRSVHAVAEAAQAGAEGAADYLIFGPVFATASKPHATPAGAAMLEAVVRATTIPVLAVGGVTPQTAAAVARAGGGGVAAIGLFTVRGDEPLGRGVAALRQAFDSARRGS